MEYREELEKLGVNVEEALERVMDDEPLYEMMLGIFVDTVNETPISLEDFDGNNVENLANQVHMMKGMTGNLSITPLFNAYKEVLELLRANKPKEAEKAMERLLPVQEKIVECIESHKTA